MTSEEITARANAISHVLYSNYNSLSAEQAAMDTAALTSVIWGLVTMFNFDPNVVAKNFNLFLHDLPTLRPPSSVLH